MGTLERARGGVLRVGMTEADWWARRDGRARSGVEVELVSRFAESLGARIEWTDGSEEELFEQLHVVVAPVERLPGKSEEAGPT